MPEREPFDPLAPLRAMGDIQRAGLEAAASVVERILEMGRPGAISPSFHLPAQPLDGADSNGTETPTDSDAGAEADRARELRRLRADGERLLELWGEWLRVLLDAAMDGAEAGVAERNGAARAGDGAVRLGPAQAGHPASTRAWLHVFDGPPGPPAPLSATDLTAHDGAKIEGRSARFEPPTVDTFDLRSSHELLITVDVPPGTRPGTYHGHILAAGLPEISLPIRLEVAG